jgi:predicted histidine transporter YuiF (NhaC family)
MNSLVLALSVYALAIVISMLVAVLIKGIVVSLSLTQKRPAPLPPAPAVVHTAAQDDIAVIAAAVYTILGAHRIVHIENGERGHSWTAAARASHHSSHNIEHHSKH